MSRGGGGIMMSVSGGEGDHDECLEREEGS